MTFRNGFAAVAAVAALGIAGSAHAAVIDFEDGTDDQEIAESTFDRFNVTFTAVENIDLFYEERGSNGIDGFLDDPAGEYDQEDEDTTASLGNYFMRTNEAVSVRDLGGGGKVFQMTYQRAPEKPISGQIWDIDGNESQGTEQWRVEAFDADNALIATVVSPLGTDNRNGSLNAEPWTFTFDGAGYDLASVNKLTFDFIGSKTEGIGLGFDNFQTGAPVPLPAAAWFLITALGGLFGARWLKRGKTEA